MFINDVIRNVQDLYPSEYDLGEMYMWCNEVSSMLLIEDRNVFKSVTLPVSEDGTFLLPEGVTMEYVEYITAGNLVLNKKDMRSYGGRKIYIRGLNGFERKNPDIPTQTVTVEYLEPYRPIRLSKYRGAVEFDADEGTFYIPVCEFVPGDILTIQIDAGSDDGQDLDKVPLLGVDYDADRSKYVCTVPAETFETLIQDTDDDTLITRIITERTVCDPPYDSMYIDYVLAKICYFQRDMSAYNQHMTAFNSRLDAYKRWLMGRMPSDDSTFKNWW